MNNKNEIICNGKTFFNKFMLFLCMFFCILCIFYTFNENSKIKLNSIFFVIFLIIIFSIPLLYYLGKIINFKFVINNENILYKNIYGKTRTYSIKDIVNIKFYNSTGDNFDSIVLKMSDKKLLELHLKKEIFIN